MRATIREETCCELLLYMLIEHDICLLCAIRKENRQIIRTVVRTGSSSSFDTSVLFRRFSTLQDSLRLKEEELTTRFGVVCHEDGKCTEDMKKWYLWWKSWFEELPASTLRALPRFIHPFTGEMDSTCEEYFRPAGRWQDVQLNN